MVAPANELARAVHFLGNNIHSLTLRLYVLKSSVAAGHARTHVDAAHRLAQQSGDLVERIHALLESSRTPPPRGGVEAARRSRK